MRAWEWSATTNNVSWLSELEPMSTHGADALVQSCGNSFPVSILATGNSSSERSRGASVARAITTQNTGECCADGSFWWVEARAKLFRDHAGNPTRLMGLARDISEKKQAEDDLRYRDKILHAVMIGAAEIMTTTSLDEAMPRVLETVGNTIRVDRVVVIEIRKSLGEERRPSLAYVWQTPEVPQFLPDHLAKYPIDDPDIQAWLAPLREGRSIGSTPVEAKGLVSNIFSALKIVSMLRVPIFVDRTLWGILGVEDCRTERQWKSAESDTLTTLADMIGSSVVRERYVKDLANADAIVRNSSTIIFRIRAEADFPVIYISPNVSQLGHACDEVTFTSNWLRRLIHPEDQTTFHDALQGWL